MDLSPFMDFWETVGVRFTHRLWSAANAPGQDSFHLRSRCLLITNTTLASELPEYKH